jgi:ATP-binding cassette subfamily F protein 3
LFIVHKVSKSYNIQTILDEVSFVVNAGDQVGLVGPNGCGKSTLLRLIAGVEMPDSGHVSFAPEATLGYLRQGLEPTPGRTVAEEVCAGIVGWEAARRSMGQLAARMAEVSGEALDGVMAEYEEAAARFEALGGYEVEHRVAAMLAHLGLAAMDPSVPVEQLSGGEQTRVGLAGILLAEPTVLLLDEPTNHLDIGMLEWLEGFLSDYAGAVLMVSHDRTFLDHTVTRILAIDDRTHQLTEYTGSYSDYAAARQRELEKHWAAWRDQEAEVRRVRQDIHRTKMHAMSVELTTTPGEPGVRRIARKVAKKAKSREKRLERYLDSEDRVERPASSWQMKLDFGEMPRGGQKVIVLDDLGHGFEPGRWLFREAALVLTHGERIALLGPNGCGKTTLLRLIAGELTPAEGSVRLGANVHLGYMPQKQEALDPDVTPLSLIQAATTMNETDARHFLHFFLFAGDEVFVPVHQLSYGERSRLLLAKLVIEGTNCLVLDEPVNHLDIPSRERFEAALASFPGAVLAAVHDRAFIDRFATGIWSIEGGAIRRYIDRVEMQRVREGVT